MVVLILPKEVYCIFIIRGAGTIIIIKRITPDCTSDAIFFVISNEFSITIAFIFFKKKTKTMSEIRIKSRSARIILNLPMFSAGKSKETQKRVIKIATGSSTKLLAIRKIFKRGGWKLTVIININSMDNKNIKSIKKILTPFLFLLNKCLII